MFTTLEERARILDDHLTSMGEDIVDVLRNSQGGQGDQGVAELEAVGVPRQEKVTCVGRICNEVGADVYVVPHNYFELSRISFPRAIMPLKLEITCAELTHSDNFQAHEGRINQTSVLLEGTRQYSNGTRIHLDLTQLNDNKLPYSLFPCQIVAVEGMNIFRSRNGPQSHRLWSDS